MQQASEANKDSALILGVSPGFKLNYKGASRLKAQILYSLTAVERFTESGLRDDITHSLNAATNAELASDLLFIDAHANVNQVMTSLLGSPGGSSLNTRNLTTVGSYSISPYLVKRFGTYATGNLRLTNSGALFENSSSNNINANTVQASLNSGTRFNDLDWSLNYSLRDAATRNDGNNQFEHYDVTLGYALARTIRVFGSAGYDNNDYPSVTKTSGSMWTAGLGWAPTRRTSITGSVGHSYFGNTYGLNFNHRSHFSTWSLAYKEGVNDFSQQVVERGATYVWDCGLTSDTLEAPASGCSRAYSVAELLAAYEQGLLTPALTELLTKIGAFNLGLTNGVFVSKTLNGGVAWTRGKNTFGLNVFDSKRFYQQLGGLPGDETRGVSALYDYKLDPHTTISSNLSFTNNVVPALVSGLLVDRDDDIYIGSVGITRQFQPKLSGSLVYRHTVRNSNVSSSDFTENNLTALVNLTF